VRGNRDANLQLLELARRQHGVVSRAQLVALGLGVKAVEYRLRTGRLVAIHRGVYAVGHDALRREGWWMGAVLAYGLGSFLSHHTAAAVWGMRAPRTRIDVSMETADGRRSKRGTVLHRVRSLPASETTRHDGLPVTTVARTLLDLAAVIDDHALEQAVHHADLHHRFDLRDVRRVLDAHPGREGTPALCALVDRLLGTGAQLTRSRLEQLFRRLCRDHRLPEPAVNARVSGEEVDFWWPPTNVVVEVDGGHHRMPLQRERDHAKRLGLEAAGYRVIPLTGAQVQFQAARTAAQLRAVLAQAGLG
jgi:very-short-patch-repair endonuclease